MEWTQDPRLLHAFEHPEEYDWTLPDIYERAINDALDGGTVYTHNLNRDLLLQVALSQPEPIRITLHGYAGYKVTRPI